jgi:hypothetical protein
VHDHDTLRSAQTPPSSVCVGQVNLAELLDKYVGESEKNVERLFKARAPLPSYLIHSWVLCYLAATERDDMLSDCWS